jgi:putative lipoic acid-binding regulatory protein
MSHGEADSLIQYPCDFPIKVMGAASADFPAIVCRMVRAHAPDFDAASIQTRASTSGKYVSVTCTVRAVSRDQLDGLYRDLSTHPAVAMVL